MSLSIQRKIATRTGRRLVEDASAEDRGQGRVLYLMGSGYKVERLRNGDVGEGAAEFERYLRRTSHGVV
jgi:hypothetical protein